MQYGVELRPDHAPWRDLFRELDICSAGKTEEAVSALDEADAIVACCWRYGSYAHVLSAGELYPPFRTTRALSRLTDGEMHRINLEFSSALAQWWTTRAAHPAPIYRRVRAALKLLPLSWRKLCTLQAREAALEARVLVMTKALDRLAEQLHRLNSSEADELERRIPAAPTPRHEANYAVMTAYRNGEIENLHAGHWNQGTEIPGFLRLYSREINTIAADAALQLGAILIVRERGHPMFRYLAALGGPTDWSLTEETRAIRYSGLPEAGPLDARMQMLAERCPIVYGSLS
jgi:hypothetical protein